MGEKTSKSGKKYRIFLSAAEPSGDKHCANLIKALKAENDDIEFVGVGGELMQKQGCELIEQKGGFAGCLRFTGF